MKKEMLINVLQPEEIRIAIVEDGTLEELYVERTSHESYVGNIYKGRIVNIEPSIQAAFVDFGVGRNGFLHVSDVEPAYYRHLEQRERGSNQRRGGNNGPNRGRPQRRYADFDDEPVSEQPAQTEDWDEPIPEVDPAHLTETFDDSDQDQAFGEIETITIEESLYEDDDAPFESESEAPPLDPTFTETEDRFQAAVEQTPEVRAEKSADHVTEPVTDEPLAVEESGRGKNRGKGRGRGRRAPRKSETAAEKARKAESAAAEEKPEEIASESDKDGGAEPRFMESAERRTREDDPSQSAVDPRPDPFSDEELSFSMASARQEERPPPPKVPIPPHEERPAPVTARFEEPEENSIIGDDTFHTDQDREAEPDSFDEEADEPPVQRDSPHFIDDQDEPPTRRPEPRRPEPRRDDRRDTRRGGPSRGGPPQRRGGRPGMLRPKPLIQDIFKRGQEVLVQVIKEGIGTKGPTLSTYISIAGRYLVLMPGLNRIGVSRKIQDDESRRRLRDILSELQPPRGLGFIIRTAGMDRNKKELQRDLAYLSRLWQVVARRVGKIKSPAEIYQESDMITRTIRDIFTSEIDTIWVDEKNAYEHAKEFLQIVMPLYASRIKFYDSTEPMFHKYGIENEIARIQQRHVPLPAGGSIVIDQTEALVAIDVNSGNFRADNNAEETAYQMNLRAAKEIARQLRLRDLGGVIVNDFIDMRDEKHRRGVERAMRDAVRRDRARTKILKISQFGIIEMTRQRIRPSLKRSVYQDCPHCRGTGQIKTCESMSIDVMRLLQLATHREQVSRIEVRVHDDVAHYLLNRKRLEIARLEEDGTKQIFVRSAAEVSPEFMEFTCFDSNNNEMKFLPYEEPAKTTRRGR